MAEEEDLFSRWSRRKKSVADETVRETPSEVAPADEQPIVSEQEEDEAELLKRLRLPVPESLKMGDNFAAFMVPGVPEFLKRRALRVLWRSNPVLANLDGLNDYDDDFNSPELTKKVIATGYRVGRGFVRDILEDSGEKDVTPPEEVTEEETEIVVSVNNDTKDLVGTESRPDGNDPASEADEAAQVRPRRMRFSG